MTNLQTQLLILGGGPGGYVAAIRAAQLGVETTLVEAESLGGTCLNIGCIPSKALIHAAAEFEVVRNAASGLSPLGIRAADAAVDLVQMQAWKSGAVRKLTAGVESLLRKAGVRLLKGKGKITDGKTVHVESSGEGSSVRINCEHLLLATGSKPVELSMLPFDNVVVCSTEALEFDELPRHLVVVGAGYIGLELGMAWRRLGAQVAVVEAGERILPSYGEELARPVRDALQRLGITLHLGCTVQGLADDRRGLRVRSPFAEEFVLPADKVLVAAGRRPNVSGYGLESLQLSLDRGAVKVDAQCRTSMRNVWAIGDLTGEPMLAHRAMAQAEVAAEVIAGNSHYHFAPMAIPAVCFTDPEVVTVGQTQAQATADGLETISAAFPLAANGRTLSVARSDGFVRVVARQDNHLIVGWQAVGTGVSELSAAFCHSIEMAARLEDVGAIIHAHPTVGEALQEAALRALGRALHV